MREHDDEPVLGLPERLPEGETVLWQGSPVVEALARRAFFFRAVAIYFGVLMLWRGVAAYGPGATLVDALSAAAGLLPVALAGLGVIRLLAWVFARATLYTVTNRRVVIRTGVALVLTANLPFARIASASARLHADGTGDIALATRGEDRIAFLALWPNMRPWRYARPEPSLRAVPEGARVARILADALAAHAAAFPQAAEPAPARSAAARPAASGATQSGAATSGLGRAAA